MQEQGKVGRYQFLAEPFHCDFSSHIFMGHLGNHLLNAADFHSNDRGFGMNYLFTQHKTWVLSRLAIEMDAMPRAYDRFFVETWVENAMRFFTARNFKIESADGTTMGYGRSVWAMIDTETRQPADILKIHDGLINNYIEAGKECPIDPLARVRIDNNAELVRSIGTNYSDIDVNGHVNSVKYIEHVLDLFPLDYLRSHTLKRIDIAYVAETHCGDTLNFYMEKNSETDYLIRIAKTTNAGDKPIEVVRICMKFLKT